MCSTALSPATDTWPLVPQWDARRPTAGSVIGPIANPYPGSVRPVNRNEGTVERPYWSDPTGDLGTDRKVALTRRLTEGVFRTGRKLQSAAYPRGHDR